MTKRIIIFLLVASGIAILIVFLSPFDSDRTYTLGQSKDFSLSVDGAVFRFSGVTGTTVGEALGNIGESIASDDRVFPDVDDAFISGMGVAIDRGKRLSIKVDGEERNLLTYTRTVSEALDEAGVSVREEDIVKPLRDTMLSREMSIVVIRVEVREESAEKKIPFKTIEKEDSELSWRKRVVTQKGENGIRTYRYRVSYHDGKEVARKLLGSEVTQEPVDEVVTQGTFVKVGKSHKGAASWYAWTGTMAAANPWLPMGSYVRVTNVDNGKSVIVKINDRGPFVPGRIIDLDKVAFQKIASVGAGVINVKMEEITN